MADDILQGMYDYLVGTTTTGNTVRDDAREDLRDLVNDRIYRGRIPQHERSDIVLVMSESSADPIYALDQETDCMQQVIDVDIYARETADTHASRKIREVFEALHKTLTAYTGSMGDVTVGKCLLISGPTDVPVPPPDASNGWTQRQFVSWDVGYGQTVPTS